MTRNTDPRAPITPKDIIQRLLRPLILRLIRLPLLSLKERVFFRKTLLK
jgi:hypothetical protein